MLIFTSLCQLVLRISGNKNMRMLHENTSQCKIFIVPEEGWFGQPKYSTHSNKTIPRWVGFYLYILHFVCEADRPFATNDHMLQNMLEGQAYYYSGTGTFKQRPVKLDWLHIEVSFF